MSMLDAFFNKGGGFRGPKCKTLLKLTIPRIKLLRNRREIQLKQMRRDIAKLLENGQEATARIRVEHIIREENMMAAQEIIELFCELISVRLPIIETQRECPLDLKEAISSICFAAPRCSDLPELLQVQMLFAAKYGKEFVAAASELMPDCGVNRQIIELLSVRAPSAETKLKLLKEIAEEHELAWDPAASESEFLKPHEDLLNGPNQFIGGSASPLPKEKHEPLTPNLVKESDEESDTDVNLDSLDLPEVPRASVRAFSDIPAPDFSATRDYSQSDHDVAKSTSSDKGTPHVFEKPKEIDDVDSSLAFASAPPNVPPPTKETNQFIPFVLSPSMPYGLSSMKQSETPSGLPQNKIEAYADSLSPPSASRQRESASSFSQIRGEANVDLQDVLAAAQTAAESAERAAAAARAAASLAQVRITELITKRSTKLSDDNGNEFQRGYREQLDTTEKPIFDKQSSFGSPNHVSGNESTWSSGSPTAESNEVPKMVVGSPNSKENAFEHLSGHQPQRLTSLEDDPYFSYPNLFASPNSNLKTAGSSFDENSRSAP